MTNSELFQTPIVFLQSENSTQMLELTFFRCFKPLSYFYSRRIKDLDGWFENQLSFKPLSYFYSRRIVSESKSEYYDRVSNPYRISTVGEFLK